MEKWGKVINALKTHLGTVDNLEENYARFNDTYEGFEIEVILLRGHDAVVDKKLTECLINSNRFEASKSEEIRRNCSRIVTLI